MSDIDIDIDIDMSKYGVAACPTSSRLRGSLIKDSSEIYVMLGEREKMIKVVKFD